jgi:putative transcriptional regulator
MTGAEPSAGGPRSRQGRLLVAAPTLMDPHFQRAVLVMLEHSGDGALGLVLNQPTEIHAVDALPEPLCDLVPEAHLIHRGGPVQPAAVIILAEFDTPGRAAGIVVDRIGIVDPEEAVDDLAGHVGQLRVFGGYAGWGPGQLEGEIAEGAWIDVPAQPEDIFTTTPERLWSAALERKGGAFRLIARMPEDPSLN